MTHGSLFSGIGGFDLAVSNGIADVLKKNVDITIEL